MAQIKLSGTLPKEDDQNGLLAVAQALVNKPHELHVALIVFDADEVKRLMDKAVMQARARIRRIEVIADPKDLNLARGLIQAAYEARTGGQRLPIDGDLLDAFLAADEQHELPTDPPWLADDGADEQHDAATRQEGADQ